MTCIERLHWAFFIISSTLCSTTTSPRFERLQLLDRDRRDEFRVGVFLGVGGVQAVLVLYVDHRPGAEHLADQEGAGVGPVGRDPPDLRIGCQNVYGGMPKNTTA